MIGRRISSAFLCLFVASLLCAQSIESFNPFLQSSRQVLFVKTTDYTAVQGTLQLYERKNNRGAWKLVYSFPVTVGRAGLAKDARTKIPFADSTPAKHEGDGKSPAGIFSLGSVFSYHDMKKLKMPFVQLDTTELCVDDENSAYYNTLITSDTSKHDYNSFEYMKRNDSLYEYGIWVLYNSDPVVPGKGSCIFIHVWQNQNSPTAGCTAMSKENILKLIYRLDKRKNPVLLQVVKE